MRPIRMSARSLPGAGANVIDPHRQGRKSDNLQYPAHNSPRYDTETPLAVSGSSTDGRSSIKSDQEPTILMVKIHIAAIHDEILYSVITGVSGTQKRTYAIYFFRPAEAVRRTQMPEN